MVTRIVLILIHIFYLNNLKGTYSMNNSTRKSFKRKITSNPITSGMTVNEDINIYATEDDKDEIDLNFDNDEMIERLDIIIDYAEWDLERYKKLLVKAEDYEKLYEKLVKHLNICRKSYVKVLSYSSQMANRIASSEINYASSIGYDLSVDLTDDNDTTASVFATKAVVAATKDATNHAIVTSYD